ncbi:PqqD family protein [Chloroflexota bacterium]
MDIKMDAIYVPSEDIVAREIEGELIIVPLVAGIGSMADEIYTVNETAKVIWDQLDGKKDLREVTAELSKSYDAQSDEIYTEVLGFVEELVRRRILVEVTGV